MVIVVFIIAVTIFLYRKKIRKLSVKYGNAAGDAGLAIKIIVSFLQINMTMPGMMSDSFTWPEQHVEFLNRVGGFVSVDFLSIIGVQCVVDVDFRLSVAVTMCVPIFIFLMMISIYFVGKHRIIAGKHRVIIDDPEQLRKIMGKLFDLGDFDLSGEIDSNELRHVFEILAINNKSRLVKISKMKQKSLQEMIIDAGGKVSWIFQENEPPQKTYTIDRGNFIIAATLDDNKAANDGVDSLADYIPKEEVVEHVKVRKLFSMCLSILVQLFLLFHAPVSAKAFYYFDCHRLGDAKSLLRKDYSLECYGDRYNEYLPFAWILLLGFALLVPFSLSGFLFYHRNELHTPITRAKIGFLYKRFHVGSEFWEIHELVRKMILTGLLIYLPPSVRPPSAIVVSLIDFVQKIQKMVHNLYKRGFQKSKYYGS